MAKKNTQEQNAREYMDNEKLYSDLENGTGIDFDKMPTLTYSESKDTPKDNYNPGVDMGVIGPISYDEVATDFRPVLEYTERWEDENGNVTENQTAVTVDDAPAVIVNLQDLLIHEAVRLASCGDGECLEDNTQFGGRIFSATDVILYCYRLEVSKSDAEISLFVAGLVKAGVLLKAEKRGTYQASAIMRMSIKGVRELAEKKLNSR